MPNIISTKQTKKITNNTYILLSAGKSRKRQLPINLVNDLLDYQINTISSFDKTGDIINVVGYKSQLVLDKNFRCRNVENLLFETTDVSESLRNALNSSLHSNLFIINGDIKFNQQSLSSLMGENISIPISPVDVPNKKGITEENGILINLSYGIKNTWGEVLYVPYQHYFWLKKEINAMNKKYTLSDIIDYINPIIPISVKYDKHSLYCEIR